MLGVKKEFFDLWHEGGDLFKKEKLLY